MKRRDLIRILFIYSALCAVGYLSLAWSFPISGGGSGREGAARLFESIGASIFDFVMLPMRQLPYSLATFLEKAGIFFSAGVWTFIVCLLVLIARLLTKNERRA